MKCYLIEAFFKLDLFFFFRFRGNTEFSVLHLMYPLRFLADNFLSIYISLWCVNKEKIETHEFLINKNWKRKWSYELEHTL